MKTRHFTLMIALCCLIFSGAQRLAGTPYLGGGPDFEMVDSARRLVREGYVQSPEHYRVFAQLLA